MSGPLSGLKVIEFAGIGPGPFCGMLLADMGADVLRLDRVKATELGIGIDPRYDVLGRGKRSIGLDLKQPAHVALALELVATADALIEGFRPGVMERLGLGPEVCLAKNPKLVFGRMTGWGQDGPLAPRAGHDINYIALTGALHAIGRAGQAPVPPLALLGDFGGGAMFLAFGLVSALLEAQRSGRGQVVDAAIADGVALLMAPFYARHAAGLWNDERGANVLDGGAPWYDSYETADGAYVSIGAIESRFYAELLRRLGLDQKTLPEQHDRSNWPKLREIFAARFREQTREAWCRAFEGSDACFAPVQSIADAPSHPHFAARGTFSAPRGYPEPAPGPRLSRTPGEVTRAPPRTGEGGAAALADWGLDTTRIAAVKASGAVCDA
ncbi:MAG: CoA transferase [Betaproteobacteria bacterium]|nr:CoA transferase [Betaproteobacteria bacterium]